MKLFNPKFKDVIRFRQVTYHENVMVEKGFCEVHNPYSIARLKRSGFIEIVGPKEKVLEKKETITKIKPEKSTQKQTRKSKKSKVKFYVDRNKSRSSKLPRS